MKRTMQWMGAVALAVLCAGGLQAQTPAPSISGVAHVAIRVSDLDQEVAFFGRLGYERAFATMTGGKTMEVVLKINDNQFIHLYPRTSFSQPLGLDHICYETDDARGLQALYAAHGLKPSPVETTSAGNLLFTLTDPQGRVNEFLQYMPAAWQAEDHGKHLGVKRVSNEMMGFNLPVNDLAPERAYFTKLGFDVHAAEDGSLRLSLAGNPEVRIELHTARVGDAPQYLFPVPDARAAADLLHHARLKVERDGKLVLVRDPDGNTFVLMQTGEHGLLHDIPWIH